MATSNAEACRRYKDRHPERVAAARKTEQARANARERQRRYRERHPERVKAQRATYYDSHRDEMCERTKKYNAEHREQVRDTRRRYYLSHRVLSDKQPMFRAADFETTSELQHAYYMADHERHLEQHRRYRRDHRDSCSVHVRNYRARKMAVPGSHTRADVDAQFGRQRGRCFWCKKRLTDYHVDHVTPIALGGSNGPENLVISCPTCNLSKQAKHPIEMGVLL